MKLVKNINEQLYNHRWTIFWTTALISSFSFALKLSASDIAAWVQAIGTIFAVVSAIEIAGAQSQLSREDATQMQIRFDTAIAMHTLAEVRLLHRISSQSAEDIKIQLGAKIFSQQPADLMINIGNPLREVMDDWNRIVSAPIEMQRLLLRIKNLNADLQRAASRTGHTSIADKEVEFAQWSGEFVRITSLSKRCIERFEQLSN